MAAPSSGPDQFATSAKSVAAANPACQGEVAV
ncbi:hypothetical protein X738_17635 [Mesorhizobium sp. LNHC209A00]|nr:hypothetical protein X741_11865 [Mesorhizobium sp. LNHC229A00]ESY98062.1 hypothetical protein X738_17635 [Mesorhizobium sp. LNHC209A00]